MLFPGRTESNPLTDAVVVWPHHQAVAQTYFCANLSCLSDDLLVQQASSYRNVWLVTELSTDRTWLMRAANPSCPCCGAPLYAAMDDDAMNEQAAIDYAVADYLLADHTSYSQLAHR